MHITMCTRGILLNFNSSVFTETIVISRSVIGILRKKPPFKACILLTALLNGNHTLADRHHGQANPAPYIQFGKQLIT